MTTATRRVRKLHHRRSLNSSSQLAEARQPQVDASREAVADYAQRIAERYGMSDKEAMASVLKRRKWEEQNNWYQLQRSRCCWLPESQNN